MKFVFTLLFIITISFSQTHEECKKERKELEEKVHNLEERNLKIISFMLSDATEFMDRESIRYILNEIKPIVSNFSGFKITIEKKKWFEYGRHSDKKLEVPIVSRSTNRKMVKPATLVGYL